jgi:hypothetical protein
MLDVEWTRKSLSGIYQWINLEVLICKDLRGVRESMAR